MDQTSKDPSALSNWSPPLPGEITIHSKPGAPRPYRGATETHKGVDIPAPVGTPVLAIGDGIVTYVYDSWKPGDGKQSGNFVVVEHPGGIRSLYMHLSKITVTVGAKVTGGKEIAKTGQTGGSRATHPDASPMEPEHLHFAIEANDTGTWIKYDPTKFVNSSPAQAISAKPAPQGFFAKLTEFFNQAVEAPAKATAETKATPEQEDAIRRGHDLAERLQKGEVETGDPRPNTEEEQTLRHAHDIGERLAEHGRALRKSPSFDAKPAGRPQPVVRPPINMQFRNDIQQRLQQGLQNSLHQQEMQRNEEQRRQQQTQLQEQLRRQQDQQRRTAEQQRQSQALRDQQQRQAQQQRMAEQARRDAQMRRDAQRQQAEQQRQRQEHATRERQQQEQWRTAQLNVQRNQANTNQFSRPFVSPKLWTQPHQNTMTLPMHVYSPPKPAPAPFRPFTPAPFSRPNPNHGLYS
jgi:hypothetical protein